MLAQRQVEREMEQDFEDFGRSELWFSAPLGIQILQAGKRRRPSHTLPSDVHITSSPTTGHASPARPNYGRSQQSLPLVEPTLAPEMERTVSFFPLVVPPIAM